MTSVVITARPPPPFSKTTEVQDGQSIYAWDISSDEKNRLTRLIGRNFDETQVKGIYTTGARVPCEACGKWTEFIDWVYTALKRDVHSPEFIFNALKNRATTKESMHDVYCSECGKLTEARSRNRMEGGAETIDLAGPLETSRSLSRTLVSETRPTLAWQYGFWYH